MDHLKPQETTHWTLNHDAPVNELHDTPLHTGIYHPAEETLALWK